MMQHKQAASETAAAHNNNNMNDSPAHHEPADHDGHDMMGSADVNGMQHVEHDEYGNEMGPDMGEGGQVIVSSALAEQRASKKRAQDDVKLLANRIALLKLEEKKVSALSLRPSQSVFVTDAFDFLDILG